MTKKIRVRITEKVASYTTNQNVKAEKYYPGDEVEVDSASFVADFMEKVEKPKKELAVPIVEEPTVSEEKPVATEEAPPTEEPVSETPIAKPKKKK